MADIDRREIRNRKIPIRYRNQRNTERLFDKKYIVAIDILRLIVGQLHRHSGRHFEDRIPNGPFTDDTSVLTHLHVVVDIPGMNRITFSRVRYGNRQVLVLGLLPLIKSVGSARSVIQIKTGRRRNIMRYRQPEIRLPKLLLSRFKVLELEIGLFQIVERDVLHAVGIYVKPCREVEVPIFGSFEIVIGKCRLTQSAQSGMSDPLLVEGIIDPPGSQRRIQRIDFHFVVITINCPREIGKSPYGIVEEIGFERFTNSFFLGGIGLFGLLIRIIALKWIGADRSSVRVVAIL